MNTFTTADKFYGAIGTLLILWLYILIAWVEQGTLAPTYNEAQASALRAALNATLADEERAKAAQQYCGQAGWKISQDNKTLTCLPRRGKLYSIALPKE